MVRLHHFGTDGREFFLNPDLILTFESKPDTIVQLTNGHEIYVAESAEEVRDRVLQWHAAVLRAARIPETAEDGEVRADA